ncbi:MAG: ferrous iron transporter B, partial [Desulfobulbaceae bacterium]|nr:ferrous iron transporter B [Desulfobulbaceae bacterium]
LISGIIDGVGGVLGFVPLILFMFFAIAVMEDSGYMARVAYMLDRILRWFGLHGNSVMAMVISGGISGGCAVPGVLATRVLKDPKERIATLLVVPFMNCGAKLPVYAMLITAFFSKDKARIMFFLTLLSWAFALFAAKILRSTVLRGPKTPFVMELPPYRAPTIKGLLIHSWERTWHYIKKAGTVILAFSVILWAMMTFPGLSKEQTTAFENRKDVLIKAFLDSPDIQGLLKSREDLKTLDHLFVALQNRSAAPESLTNTPEELLETAHAAVHLKNVDESNLDKTGSKYVNAGSLYLNLREQLKTIDLERHQTALKRTIAGWIGIKLEMITRPLGFDYRTNIALVAGFAAKEVVVSTLGTAYSLGEVAPEDTGSLSEKLKTAPGWNPLQAFTLIVFTMLYVPCMATVASIRKESSIRWAGFSILFNLTIAYLAAFIIRQAGILVGLGT